MNDRRDKYLVKTYGITLAQYTELLKAQKNKCAICRKHNDEKRNLAVDHNHKTGEIRGLLCFYCNHRRVGRLTDPDLVRKTADYLSQGTGLFVPKKKKK